MGERPQPRECVVPSQDLTERSLRELMSLAGRRAVVTGGAKGLGAAIARRLAEAGASVAIGDVDEHAARTTAVEMNARFGVATTSIALDVRDEDSVERTADTALAELGGLDIWVNNAGVFPTRLLVDMSVQEWGDVIDVNLQGAFLGCRAAARRMAAAGCGGVILNVASVAGLRGRGPGVAHYVASKHGIIGLTRQLAGELASHDIRVLAVAPTTIITPGVEAAMSGRGDLGGRPPETARPGGQAR